MLGQKGEGLSRTQAALGLLLRWEHPSAAACFLAQYGEPEKKFSVRKEGKGADTGRPHPKSGSIRSPPERAPSVDAGRPGESRELLGFDKGPRGQGSSDMHITQLLLSSSHLILTTPL